MKVLITTAAGKRPYFSVRTLLVDEAGIHLTTPAGSLAITNWTALDVEPDPPDES